MNCKTPSHADRRRSRSRRADGGFTLAEVLAALLFMAIVIPVAVAGLRIANLAGEVGTRKAVAARIAEAKLNELLITGQMQKGALSGTVTENRINYGWNLTVESSGLDVLRLATMKVTFPAQGKDYDVRLSTLVDTTQ
ncbi:MAG TPA: hypothetical protein VFV96_14535 [Verrucomicrobiae bacterium]|nr:hypothetical protein [Verrucomicrobiae bacterium]